MLMMALCGVITASSTQRSIWMRRRSQEWWDQDVAGYTEQEFFQNFRMSRNTFHHIGQRLSLRLSRDTSFRRSISLRKRVGVGLYWVATGADYRSLANLFGIVKSVKSSVLTFAKLCTRSSCLTISNYPKETISRRCCEASGRGSPSVLSRSTGAVQRGSE